MCTHAKVLGKQNIVTLVIERWSLKDRLARIEEKQDLTAMGMKRPGSEAGG